MSVNAQHPQYAKFLERWRLVRDIVDSNAKAHIITIDPTDLPRSEQYRDDAILTNFTSRTKHALVGAVFKRNPTCEIPEGIEYVKGDATGDNFTLDQLAQQSLGEVLEVGRYGLLVDFPVTVETKDEDKTKAKVEEDDLKARIYTYTAESIINWKTELVKGKTILTMVVLEEVTDDLDVDGFTWIEKTQFRVLRLVDGIYTQLIFNIEGMLLEVREVKKFDGTLWTEIPFIFIGSEDNNATVDSSPLYDLSTINIGHYKNSADMEEYVHIAGQPTLFMSSNMSTEEFKDANPNGIQIGTRKGHNLGAGGNAIMLQINATQAIDEAMKRKEQQAVMLGARLITPNSGTETAEAARLRHGSETSVLSTIVTNVENGIMQALTFLAEFQGVEEDDIDYQLNDKFFDDKIDPQAIMAQIQLFDRGIIAIEDLRGQLRKGNAIDPERTDEEIEEDLNEAAPLGISFDTEEEEQEDTTEEDSEE